MSYSIGIDLGTSNCCVSIATDRECRVVPVNNGHDQLLPSKVDFTDPNNIRVGSIVSESLIKKGNAVEGNIVPAFGDGKTHTVEVVMG